MPAKINAVDSSWYNRASVFVERKFNPVEGVHEHRNA
jgi:hypothetical protein